jgi:DNA-binding GntR family transcriptional regulator
VTITSEASESLRGTLVDDLTDRLRRAILTGEIPPGSPVQMRKFQAKFDVSHIPIREALQRLEAEGLIQKQPRRQARVAPISLDELEQVYDVRRIIEGAVAERALSRITPEQLRTASQRLTELDGLGEGPGTEAFLEAHRAFHWAVLAPGASPLIERMLQQQWQTSERYVRLAVSALHTGAVARQQHRAVLEALQARDVEGMRACIVEHLQLTEGAIRAWYTSTHQSSASQPTATP